MIYCVTPYVSVGTKLMELITAANCWQIINKFLRMNRTARRETYCRQAVHKVINFP
jgi:hypothetical protein